MQTGRVRANTLWHERLWLIYTYIYNNIHMIWHKYLVSINLMTVPHTDGRHYLRQLDLISLCVTIVTASPFVVWFKVCWKNNDILGQCHLMPLETSWNHMPPWTALTLCSPLSGSGEIRSSARLRNACGICSGSKWSKSLRSPCRRQCWHRWHHRHCRAGPLRPLGRLQRPRRPGRRSSRRHGQRATSSDNPTHQHL